ncbi:MAG: dihydroorotate dehydrogenase [Chloroflexi bacterium]|nr:dihydroorotate dehydrogenase [Chloroflexota bacterium]
MDLSVELAPKRKTGLRLENPVMTASGTFGYGTEYASLVDIQRLGAIVSKGVTLRPRKGNPQPRIVETPAGMLNSIGLQNIGIRAVVREKAPLWAEWSVPVIVNIAGDTYDEFRRLAAALEGVPGVAGVEVNISCPNVDQGGMVFGCDPGMAAQVTRCVRQETSLPVIVKLTPNVGDIRAVAQAVEEAGADALTVANTFLGMAYDLRRRRPVIPRGAAGLSGPAIKPLALYLAHQVAQAVTAPVIGCGGIASARDALEFLMAGATAVQVGTATFVDPQASIRIIEGLERYLEQQGCDTLREAVGVGNS